MAWSTGGDGARGMRRVGGGDRDRPSRRAWGRTRRCGHVGGTHRHRGAVRSGDRHRVLGGSWRAGAERRRRAGRRVGRRGDRGPERLALRVARARARTGGPCRGGQAVAAATGRRRGAGAGTRRESARPVRAACGGMGAKRAPQAGSRLAESMERSRNRCVTQRCRPLVGHSAGASREGGAGAGRRWSPAGGNAARVPGACGWHAGRRGVPRRRTLSRAGGLGHAPGGDRDGHGGRGPRAGSRSPVPLDRGAWRRNRLHDADRRSCLDGPGRPHDGRRVRRRPVEPPWRFAGRALGCCRTHPGRVAAARVLGRTRPFGDGRGFARRLLASCRGVGPRSPPAQRAQRGRTRVDRAGGECRECSTRGVDVRHAFCRRPARQHRVRPSRDHRSVAGLCWCDPGCCRPGCIRRALSPGGPGAGCDRGDRRASGVAAGSGHGRGGHRDARHTRSGMLCDRGVGAVAAASRESSSADRRGAVLCGCARVRRSPRASWCGDRGYGRGTG